ncbi:hypothetical protein E8P82_13680 [Arthrobacter echini]|uniref:Uncharacterized protein n=1 Tax=Arthrobacter echini TaxID=1529066 RepID=A0A4S5E0R7_9MICC|nr:DUF5946 family protein [Arthrobacter echini]THJ64924.1 hypothetical protein E8P82_13680 [Arthrobacter echini]
MEQQGPVSNRTDPVLPCPGCGGLVPDVPGPVHPYMRASPGCWQVYGDVVARWYAEPLAGPARWHHVDAYAVQHAGGAEHDRRQRRSVAVHLITLCSLLELRQRPEVAAARRGRTSDVVLPRVGLSDWPYLEPPSRQGPVTVADLDGVRTTAEEDTVAAAWLESAWTAWAEHHAVVRTWATILQEVRS